VIREVVDKEIGVSLYFERKFLTSVRLASGCLERKLTRREFKIGSYPGGKAPCLHPP